MADLNVNSIGDASGGNTATINSYTPTESNMAGRNLIINGDFQIDQRGYSGTTGSDGTKYTVDRWNNYFASTITKSKEIIDGRNRGILTINSPASFGDIAQHVENSDAFSNQTMSLSFWAKSISGSTSVKFQIGNNVDAGMVNQNFTLTTAWQRFEFSFDVPAFSNLTGTTYSYVAFQSNNTNITWSLSEVQLEVGEVATPFEHRQYGQELALCQRYYYQAVPLNSYNTYTVVCTANSSTSGFAFFSFPVTMRAAPTLSATTGTNYYDLYMAAADRYTSSFTLSNPTTNQAQLYCTISGATAGQAGVLYIASSDAAIAFSAEL